MLKAIVMFALLQMLIMMDNPDTNSNLEPLGTYEITAYSYEEGNGENYSTAGGYEPIPYYTVAAPKDIPMGTKLYIEDIGEVQVQDRGSFQGKVIDVHVGHDSCDTIGRIERKVWMYESD